MNSYLRSFLFVFCFCFCQVIKQARVYLVFGSLVAVKCKWWCVKLNLAHPTLVSMFSYKPVHICFFYSRRSLLHQINQFVIDANDIKWFMLWNDCNDNIEQWWKHFGRWWLNDTFNSSNEPMKQNLWTEGSTFRLKANKFSFNSNAVIKLSEIFKFLPW